MQLDLFAPTLAASARVEQVQQLLDREAWRFFKVRLAESIFFGEVGRETDAVRRGNFAKARRLGQFQY